MQEGSTTMTATSDWSGASVPRTLLRADTPPPERSVAAILEAELDDATTAYALAMRQPFEDLRQAAAQLAGVLVLAAAGSRHATPDHPMLTLARLALDQATDAIRATAAPRRMRHHHRHMLAAANWIGRALTASVAESAAGGTLDADATLPLLRRGWQELQWTTGALPGFEIVAFEQGCCALHSGGTRPAARRSRA